MLGFDDMKIEEAYSLAIGLTPLCGGYGVVKRNKEED